MLRHRRRGTTFSPGATKPATPRLSPSRERGVAVASALTEGAPRRCAGAACQHGGVSARRRRSGRFGTSFGPMKRDSPCMWHATCVRVGRCILPISLPARHRWCSKTQLSRGGSRVVQSDVRSCAVRYRRCRVQRTRLPFSISPKSQNRIQSFRAPTRAIRPIGHPAPRPFWAKI